MFNIPKRYSMRHVWRNPDLVYSGIVYNNTPDPLNPALMDFCIEQKQELREKLGLNPITLRKTFKVDSLDPRFAEDIADVFRTIGHSFTQEEIVNIISSGMVPAPNPMKIGKFLLKALKNKKVKNAFVKRLTGGFFQMIPYTQDINTFIKNLGEERKKNIGLHMVLSLHPIDVLAPSTNSSFTSCMKPGPNILNLASVAGSKYTGILTVVEGSPKNPFTKKIGRAWISFTPNMTKVFIHRAYGIMPHSVPTVLKDWFQTLGYDYSFEPHPSFEEYREIPEKFLPFLNGINLDYGTLTDTVGVHVYVDTSNTGLFFLDGQNKVVPTFSWTPVNICVRCGSTDTTHTQLCTTCSQTHTVSRAFCSICDNNAPCLHLKEEHPLSLCMEHVINKKEKSTINYSICDTCGRVMTGSTCECRNAYRPRCIICNNTPLAREKETREEWEKLGLKNFHAYICESCLSQKKVASCSRCGKDLIYDFRYGDILSGGEVINNDFICDDCIKEEKRELLEDIKKQSSPFDKDILDYEQLFSALAARIENL